MAVRGASVLALFAGAALSIAGIQHRSGQEVPAILKVPAGNETAFQARATGVQIYVCNPAASDPTQFAWTFKAPEAKLFDADGTVLGTHYAGPTWESSSGGKVVGAMLQSTPAPDGDAIPWLLLQAKPADDAGVFRGVTFVQRLHTTGGKVPATGCDAASVGREARVPYTADYFFYRKTV
jgi:hypothetical protein